jgi:hypothetical protein
MPAIVLRWPRPVRGSVSQGDGHPLLLPAGQLVGSMPDPVGQPNPLQHGEGALARLARRDADQQQRQLDIFGSGENGNEV